MLTKRTIFIWGTLGALLTGAGIWWWLENLATPPPPIPSTISAPVAKVPEKQPAATKTAPVHEVAPPQTVLTAGNLGKVTDIKGRIEVLKLEVQEEELKQKKKALSAPAPVPVVTAPKFPELDLPAFTPSKSTPRPSPRAAGTAVIAVQGVDGDLRAIVRTSTGAVTVRKGMNFGGGVITDISRQGVLIRKNNTVTTLPFE